MTFRIQFPKKVVNYTLPVRATGFYEVNHMGLGDAACPYWRGEAGSMGERYLKLSYQRKGAAHMIQIILVKKTSGDSRKENFLV
jgi:hypothetical protein